MDTMKRRRSDLKPCKAAPIYSRAAVFKGAAAAGLLLNATALACAWSGDLMNIRTDASVRLPFGIAIPILHEEHSFSLFGSLAQFYQSRELLVFGIIGLFGVVVPIAKLFGSALLITAPRTRCASRLLFANERVGRWAMVDVFALAVLTVVLKVGDELKVELCPAFYAFVAAALMPLINGIVIERFIRLSQTTTGSPRL